VNPGSIDFGSVIVGQSTTKTGSVTASGSSVVISSVSPSTAEFSVSGIALPKTLSAGQSASYSVTFTPQASGATSASLQFASNAATPVVAEALTGSGAAAPSHSVDLSWNASSSTVAGYNVYRGTVASGPFTKLNSTLDAGTTFTDNNVQSGTTYYYVATSVDDTGAESGYSTAVPASVPTP
jgi:TolB protein